MRRFLQSWCRRAITILRNRGQQVPYRLWSCSLSVEGLEARTVPAEITWTGKDSTAWDPTDAASAENWKVTKVNPGDKVKVDQHVIPTKDDDVIIPEVKNSPIARNGPVAKSVKVLAEADLTIRGGLDVASNFENEGDVEVDVTGKIEAPNGTVTNSRNMTLAGLITAKSVVNKAGANLSPKGIGGGVTGNLTNDRANAPRSCYFPRICVARTSIDNGVSQRKS